MNALTSSNLALSDTENSHLDFWSRRYLEEGHIWGDDASLTAQLLAEKLIESDIDPSLKSVLEVGFGYGRDIKELAITGAKITGIELASAALTQAAKEVSKYIDLGRVQFVLADFNHSNSWKNNFDAISSHRVLHLLGNNGLVRTFASRAAAVLKEDGLLYISARDTRDFSPEQMEMTGQNLAVYKDRPEHLISFWDEARFRDVFGRKFEILGFRQGTEIESQKNPVPSHFTLMMARKKPEPTP